ncbi:MAG: FHA domain-containing protein [Desulfobacteraceae bacterium]|nr:MAG: FHA domain-containing protein [Desulfobacteraceae bacterium]
MAKLYVIEGPFKGKTFDLDGETVFIGRSSRNDIQIKDVTISRKQIKIFRIGKKFLVEDLKSTNGTMINGELIEPGEGFEVDEGDTISIGNTVVRLGEISSYNVLDKKDLLPPSYKGNQNEKDSSEKDRRSRSPKNLALIYKVSELLRQSLNINEIFEKILEYLFETLPRIDRVAILLYDNEKMQITQVNGRSRQDQGAKAIYYSQPVVDKVFKDGKAVRMSDTAYEPPSTLLEDMGTAKIRSVLCVPIISNSKISGAIYVDSVRVPYGFRKEDLLLFNTLSGSLAIAIEKAQLADKLKELQADSD